MRINFVFPMVWPTAVCRTLHAFSNESYYKACQVKKSLFQHNNRMQNSRIFLVFLLSFLSFFHSIVFFLKAGRGGGEGHECEKVSNEHGLLLDITFV